MDNQLIDFLLLRISALEDANKSLENSNLTKTQQIKELNFNKKN